MPDDIDTSRAASVAFRILRCLTLCLNLALQLASALSISNYSPSHSGKGARRIEKIIRLWNDSNGKQSSRDSSSILLKTTTILSNVPVPLFIVDPSAATFMSAVMIYCSAVLLYCTMGEGQRRDHFLFVGALLGTISGTLASMSNSNLELLKDYIPISITVALTMSLVWHALLSWAVWIDQFARLKVCLPSPKPIDF